MNPVPSATIENLIRQFALSLEQAIRQEVDFRMKDELRRMRSTSIAPAITPQAVSSAPQGERPRKLCTTAGCPNPAAGPKYGWKCREHGAAYRAARAGRTAAAPRIAPAISPAMSGERTRRLCTTPGCPNPAAGPKYGWKCREHGADYLAARRARRGASGQSATTAPAPRPAPVVVSLPAARAATVIPQTVAITKLPPGPTPNDPKRPGPPMECRLPGCMMKSRGPRYDFFCADHYQQLSADQRRHYADLWRQNRAGGRA